MGSSRCIFVSVLASACVGFSAQARAQVAVADEPVYGAISAQDWADKKPARTAAKKRKIDPYTLTGYDDGVFSLKPSLEIGAVASDNSQFAAAGRQAGIGYELKPSLSFATAWPVHQWTGSVSGNWTSFSNNSASDGFAGTAQTEFRLDIRRNLFVNLDASAVVSEAIAGQQQVPGNATSARRDWTIGSSASVTDDFGHYQGTAKLGVTRTSYGDVPLSTGVIIDNSALNYVEPSISLRGSMGDLRAPIKPFAEIAYTPRFHDQNGGLQNSHGAQVSLGISLNDGPIWQGEIAAVAMGRVYADPSLGVAFMGGVNGNLTWSPTALWSVTGSSTVGMSESTAPGIGALPSWVLGINATYVARENLYLHGGATMTLANNGGGIDQTITATGGADYMFNRHFGVTGTAQSTWINSSNSSSRDEQRLMVGVLLKP